MSTILQQRRRGEQVTDLGQPFWALPVVTIAGFGIRSVLAFTVVLVRV